jgi:dolichol-phosphate mannosyltransferase
VVTVVPAQATAQAGTTPTRGLWIVVPTYNERATLPALVSGLRGRLTPLLGNDFQVLIVDDASPDGTGAVADELAWTDDRIAVHHRSAKTGLGTASSAGFAAALDAGAELVLQMDADGSHNPAVVPALMAALDADNADLAIGSRYVAGGETPDWSRRRRLLSRGGCAYARLLLGLEVRDLTGGFKLWRADTLRAALAAPLTVQGYGFQIELTHRAVRGGARVTEVPIIFRDRAGGESKMGAAMVREAIVHVPRLAVKR